MNRLASTLACLASLTLHGANIGDYYKVENISTPKGLDAQIGGLTFLPDGRLAACFHRGEVYTYTPKSKAWKLFADGLQEPLGIVAEDDHTLVVMQRAELTRLRDTNKDGEADHYQTISDRFGMTGNYHEFAFGPARDREGNYFVGLNLASNGASIRPEIRGEFRHYGLTREQFYQNHRAGSGRMYSAAPWRGWVLKISPDGKTTPLASGFRSPNGVGVDPADRLWVTDNQGDWLGTSKLFLVQPGAFHGHPASLPWADMWEKGRNPLKVPAAEFDAFRIRAAVLFPQGTMANSPTQPITDTTRGQFGPFAGQLLVGEMNRPRIMRVLLDEVAGQTQGACLPFIDNGGLRRGMHRFAFAPDGSLWAGSTRLSWAGGSGLQRIIWTGKTPMDLAAIKLTADGFNLTFTKPLAKTPADQIKLQRYYYRYHQGYGSPQLGREPVAINKLETSKDGKTLALTLDKLNPGYVYQFDLKPLTATDKTPILNSLACYTLNTLTNGDDKAPHLASGSAQARPIPVKPVTAKSVRLTTSPQILDAAEAGRNGPSFDRSNAGYTGKGYADFGTRTGEILEWRVQLSTTEKYTLNFRYAVAGGNRPLRLKINGKITQKSMPFNDTGNWTTWKDISANAELKAGENIIQLESIVAAGPNIDRLQVTRQQ
tara:strand:+ start:2263 stop:4233 length:1971 start_codon:yes stop_codon:yes gene_type:complete